MVKIIKRRFDGGITNDPRDPRGNKVRVVTNGDIFTDVRRVLPYRSSESGDSAAATSKKQNFAVALRTGTTYELFALGVKSGAATAEVLRKSLTTGGSNDLGDAGWATPSNNQSAGGTASFDMFAYYQNRGKIYGGQGFRYLFSFDPTGGAWSDTEVDLTAFTTLAQGLTHSADDIFYAPYDNKIAAKDGATAWNTDAAPGLPLSHYITSIAEHGNYLAIGMAAKVGAVGKSQAFLWNRDFSQNLFDDNIQWGNGVLNVLDSVGGELIGISLEAGTDKFADRVVFRKYAPGIGAQEFLTIQGTSGTLLPKYKQVKDGRLYFQMSIVINGTRRSGLWSIGRSPFTGEWVLSHERTPNNDTALASSFDLTGFTIVGDYVFQSYVTSGAYALSKTDDQALFNHDTIIEDIHIPLDEDGDLSKFWDIMRLTVYHEPLPSGASVVASHRRDGESTYTTALTSSTENAVHKTTVASLPKGCQELEIRLAATDNAVITGYKVEAEEVKSKGV
jgi:hypothetical protein